MIESLLGYKCEDRHHIVAWSKYSDIAGPTIVVARSSMRGRRWMRAVRRIGAPGWHVSAWDTKRAATDGMYR